MYFPYLRGRQFELIALRELVEQGLIGENIIPVIEPIKPTSTLRSTLAKFVEIEKKVVVIKNPQVGNFLSEYGEINSTDNLVSLMEDNNDFIIKAHIMNPNSITEVAELTSKGTKLEDLVVVSTERDCLSIYKTLFDMVAPKYVLIPDNSIFRRSIRSNRILFEDYFPKEQRNSDYKGKDEFFSEAHLFFEDENYKGFSDYSIVGEDFNEAGFAPYAVAIHIVYFGKDGELRVKSFVSDSNDDIRDPAKKYYEALSHLMEWLKSNPIDPETYALQQFRKHHAEGTYPGLGTVKKLSIMHHLELMSNYFDWRNNL